MAYDAARVRMYASGIQQEVGNQTRNSDPDSEPVLNSFLRPRFLFYFIVDFAYRTVAHTCLYLRILGAHIVLHNAHGEPLPYTADSARSRSLEKSYPAAATREPGDTSGAGYNWNAVSHLSGSGCLNEVPNSIWSRLPSSSNLPFLLYSRAL